MHLYVELDTTLSSQHVFPKVLGKSLTIKNKLRKKNTFIIVS